MGSRAHPSGTRGSPRVDQLERADVARWPDGPAASGWFSRRSIQIFRMVLRAALADSVDVGELRRSPAARVGLPKQVGKPAREREADAWTGAELDRILMATESHRWFAPIGSAWQPTRRVGSAAGG